MGMQRAATMQSCRDSLGRCYSLSYERPILQVVVDIQMVTTLGNKVIRMTRLDLEQLTKL